MKITSIRVKELPVTRELYGLNRAKITIEGILESLDDLEIFVAKIQAAAPLVVPAPKDREAG